MSKKTVNSRVPVKAGLSIAALVAAIGGALFAPMAAHAGADIKYECIEWHEGQSSCRNGDGSTGGGGSYVPHAPTFQGVTVATQTDGSGKITSITTFYPFDPIASHGGPVSFDHWYQDLLRDVESQGGSTGCNGTEARTNGNGASCTFAP